MKNYQKFILVISLPISLFSCSKKTYYSSLKAIAPYLHEVYYQDYAEDVNFETVTRMDAKDTFGCSAIRNGNLYGRNFDYYYSECPSFLVHMKRNDKHFASLGVATHLGLSDKDVIRFESNNQTEHAIDIVPSYTLDGINEYGVVCNINILDIDDGGGIVNGTNPGKPRLHMRFLVRYVLDHATSAIDAINQLNELDLYFTEDSYMAYHFMIADINETYIVEFINGKLRYEKKEGDEQIMTNFFNNMTSEEIQKTYINAGYTYDNPKYNLYAIGTERYEIIKKDYSKTNTAEGMARVLKSVRYGDIYTNPDEPKFPSEDFSQIEIRDKTYIDAYKQIYLDTRDVLDYKKRNEGYIKDTWITTHSSIYDIKNKTVRLVVQEEFDTTYSFLLS